jgi:hypothetical protein
MDEPIYSQAEADAMIAMGKVAPFEAQLYAVTGFHRVGYRTLELEVKPTDPHADVKFTIRIGVNFDLDAYAISLVGAIGSRKPQYLCRYDVHDSYHDNSKCAHCGPPPGILPGQHHVHTYNEEAIRAGFEWHRCATLIDAAPQTQQAPFRELIGQFVDGVRLSFADGSKADDLFRTGQP